MTLKMVISPVFPLSIGISKSIVVKLADKETVDSIGQKNGSIETLAYGG